MPIARHSMWEEGTKALLLRAADSRHRSPGHGRAERRPPPVRREVPGPSAHRRGTRRGQQGRRRREGCRAGGFGQACRHLQDARLPRRDSGRAIGVDPVSGWAVSVLRVSGGWRAGWRPGGMALSRNSQPKRRGYAIRQPPSGYRGDRTSPTTMRLSALGVKEALACMEHVVWHSVTFLPQLEVGVLAATLTDRGDAPETDPVDHTLQVVCGLGEHRADSQLQPFGEVLKPCVRPGLQRRGAPLASEPSRCCARHRATVNPTMISSVPAPAR